MKKLIVYAVPLFFVAIMIEWFVTKKSKVGTYLLKDTFTSVSLGAGQLIISFFCSIFIIPIFWFFYQFKIFNIPSVWDSLLTSNHFLFWPFLLLFLVDDFIYYWFHRISHECRLFWCFHETHHSSEYYNFGTALRQSWTGVPFSYVFWLPMAILGFHIEDIFIQMSINLFYQFWVHTRYTNSIKYFDFIFNTPSHHRVHHGKNIEYLDKNYAGILIVWDRMFGTFKKEDKEPVYGVLYQPSSFNPFYVAFYMIINLIRDVFRENTILCKLKCMFYAPGWCSYGKSKTTKDLQSIFK